MKRQTCAFVLCFAPACGESEAPTVTATETAATDTTSGSSTEEDGGDSTDETTGGGAACPTEPMAPGAHSLKFMYDGLERDYDLFIPASHDGMTPTPLVFNLHPLVLGGTLGGIWTSESGMNEKAEEAGFIVVQPDGTGSPASWNAGDECCDPASGNGVDDVGFIMALADEVATRACIDPARVYSLGMSNGAYLSNRIACEHPSFVAGIGSVVGHLSAELDCDLAVAVPVIQVSGSEDSLAARTQSFEAWRDYNGCTDVAEETYAMGSATCITHDECDDGVEVTHCVVEGGGHCWFSDISPQLTPGCSPMTDLITPDVLWEFLSRFSR
jgi:polyhydroxybutyrate depolymerase